MWRDRDRAFQGCRPTPFSPPTGDVRLNWRNDERVRCASRRLCCKGRQAPCVLVLAHLILRT